MRSVYVESNCTPCTTTVELWPKIQWNTCHHMAFVIQIKKNISSPFSNVNHAGIVPYHSCWWMKIQYLNCSAHSYKYSCYVYFFFVLWYIKLNQHALVCPLYWTLTCRICVNQSEAGNYRQYWERRKRWRVRWGEWFDCFRVEWNYEQLWRLSARDHRTRTTSASCRVTKQQKGH